MLALLCGAWSEPAYADRAKVPDGKIWSSKTAGFVNARALEKALGKARFVLLGEIHDNALHHLWQAWSISVLGRVRRGNGVVALEMVQTRRSSEIDRFYEGIDDKGSLGDARAFANAVKWHRSGWPEFKMYAPVVQSALDAKFRLKAADSVRHLNRLVGRSGFDQFSAARRADLAVDIALDSQLEADLFRDIKTGHCDMLPDAMLPSMSNVQRLRDAMMADALLGGDQSSQDNVAVLVAGNGHVRRDRGVPWYLQRRGISLQDVLVVGTSEADNVDDGARIAKELSGPIGALYDFAIVTPAVKRPDPCEELRERFKKMRKR